MNIKFCGACDCVTGSCHLLRANGFNILLDCGMFQGKDDKTCSNEDFPFDPADIHCVLLSHAHMDHSGRIPFLCKKGFHGKVHCTNATKELCSVMLPDSGHIMEFECEWKNKKRMKKGMDLIEPLYDSKFARECMDSFTGHDYDEMFQICDGVTVRFQDAGHLLGSSIIELFIEENSRMKKLVYSGDIGNINIPILKDPTPVKEADYVIMETTYGDKVHEQLQDSLDELVKIIKLTVLQGGNVIIPSFSVGRTQQVLYALNKHFENNELKNLQVYVDSPLAEESTRIFEKFKSYYDNEAKELLMHGDDPLYFKGLKFTKSAEDSIKLNEIKSGAIIISASGMCDAGRIKHHLKNNLSRKECSVVFVGYQAEGTTGRAIVDGAESVRIFGEDIAVNANICNFPGLSGHADMKGLMNWTQCMQPKPKSIILVHGDPEARDCFKNQLEQKGFSVVAPSFGNEIEF